MYAYVKNERGKFYKSPVFGHYDEIIEEKTYKKYSKHVSAMYSRYYVVLNEDKTALIKKYVFDRGSMYLDPRVIIMDYRSENWVAVKRGFDCVDFLAKVNFDSEDISVPDEILEKCLQIDRNEDYIEYVDITDDDSIDNFLLVTSYLRDANVLKVEREDENSLYVLLESCWGFKLEMWFNGDVSYSCDKEVFEEEWFSASLKYKDEYYYLMTDENIEDSFCWFKAKKVRYHLIPQ